MALLYKTVHRSPQVPLWELDEGDWLKVVRLAPYVPRRKHVAIGVQERLFPE